MSVKGQRVLVTGASRGLGRAVAATLLKEGAEVVGIGRDAKALAETRDILSVIGSDFEMIALDVTDEAAVISLIGGMDRLDVVINNAGIAKTSSFLDTSVELFRETLEVNLIGAFVVMREAAKKMCSSGGGYIINIASDAALKGLHGLAPYVASKHALLGLGRTLSNELRGQGIRVTTFCPGGINTEILGPGSATGGMPPEDVARTIVDLAGLPPSIEVQELLVLPAPKV